MHPKPGFMRSTGARFDAIEKRAEQACALITVLRRTEFRLIDKGQPKLQFWIRQHCGRLLSEFASDKAAAWL
jgi:hypothetical protein